MIKINNLNKYYHKGKQNEIHVINNTSLELPSIGLVSILGPSGSGKTTLLNVIGGLDKAEGTICYDDIRIKNSHMYKVDKYRKENIGYIFQNYNLLHEETVFENLRIALELVGVTDKEEVQKRIEYTLKAVGMFKYRKKQAYALSGGQQQRVAIARALVKDAKIIIADEPTGNLDRENTVEVMNILKKISKTTLVLLVTHDLHIAEFYSDLIVKLKDGEIQSLSRLDDQKSLATNFSNYVYLKDMHSFQEDTILGECQIFSDETDLPKLNLEIIIRNGNYYIKANQPLKLIESSNLKLIDDHYEDLKINELEDISYDISWFKKKKNTFKDKLSYVLKQFGKSFIALKNARKRSKLLYIAFLCIGLLLGASIICTINFATTDTSNYMYANQEYRIQSVDHTFEEDPILNLRKNYDQNNLFKPSIIEAEDFLIFRLNMSYHKQIRLELNTLVLRIIELNINLIYGDFPKEKNEVIIDSKNAKLISKEYGLGAPIDRVIGDTIELHSKEGGILQCKIVGICDSAQSATYLTDQHYTDWISFRQTNIFGDYRYFPYEILADGSPIYEIVTGKDLVSYSIDGIGKNRQALIHDKNPDKILQTSEYLYYNGLAYEIVGTYRLKDEAYDLPIQTIFLNTPLQEMWRFSNSTAYVEEDYVMISGKEPQGLHECMTSIYSKNKIGDFIDGKEIVGIYNGTSPAVSSKSIISLDATILNEPYDKIGFHIENKKDFILNEDQTVVSLFDQQDQISKDNQASNLKIFELLSIILIIVSAIFIYLIMRSKIIADIYSIGVYRCLGAPKIKIIGNSLVDLLVLCSVTSLLGYLLILFGYNISAKYINQLFNETMLRVNNNLFLLGLLGVYGLNILIGLFPVCLLLRKTPSEICSKYDI